jgi:hypothetical protein
MAGMPSRPTPPEMISERSTVAFSKSVLGQASKSGARWAVAAETARTSAVTAPAKHAGRRGRTALALGMLPVMVGQAPAGERDRDETDTKKGALESPLSRDRARPCAKRVAQPSSAPASSSGEPGPPPERAARSCGRAGRSTAPLRPVPRLIASTTSMPSHDPADDGVLPVERGAGANMMKNCELALSGSCARHAHDAAIIGDVGKLRWQVRACQTRRCPA